MEWKDVTEEVMYGWIEESLNFKLNKDKDLTEKDVSQIEYCLDLIDQMK
jgi:hypothetical protein